MNDQTNDNTNEQQFEMSVTVDSTLHAQNKQNQGFTIINQILPMQENNAQSDKIFPKKFTDSINCKSIGVNPKYVPVVRIILFMTSVLTFTWATASFIQTISDTGAFWQRNAMPIYIFIILVKLIFLASSLNAFISLIILSELSLKVAFGCAVECCVFQPMVESIEYAAGSGVIKGIMAVYIHYND